VPVFVLRRAARNARVVGWQEAKVAVKKDYLSVAVLEGRTPPVGNIPPLGGGGAVASSTFCRPWAVLLNVSRVRKTLCSVYRESCLESSVPGKPNVTGLSLRAAK